MRVERKSLEGTSLQKLTVVDDRGTDHHVGEVFGYVCPHCMAVDESLSQVWHEDDCKLTGEHGRTHYNESEYKPQTGQTEHLELRDGYPLTLVEYATTEGRGGLCEGEVLGFRCDFCGNGDEDAFEIQHDGNCPLSAINRSAERALATGAAVDN